MPTQTSAMADLYDSWPLHHVCMSPLYRPTNCSFCVGITQRFVAAGHTSCTHYTANSLDLDSTMMQANRQANRDEIGMGRDG